MTEAVLDASVVLKWFRSEGERHVDAAGRLRFRYEAGELAVLAPTLHPLEILNVAGRRWQWSHRALVSLAEALEGLGFDRIEPEVRRVAAWVSRGLTAYDAAYVAVAEAAGIPLVTDDELILGAAPSVAQALSEQ